MKTWFNGDNEGKIKRGGSRKGTLSDELSKADRIGKQLRYNEDELNQLEQAEQKQQVAKAAPETKAKRDPLIQMSSPFPTRRQSIEEPKSKQEVKAKVVETTKPFQMSSPFPPRRQTVEETEEKPVQMSSPFPPRTQTVEEAEEKPVQTSAPFPPRIQPSDRESIVEHTDELNIPWHKQTLKPEYTIQYAAKDIEEVSNRELAKNIIDTAPKEMEIEIPPVPEIFSEEVHEEPYSHSVTTLGDMQDYSYSDSYEQSFGNQYEDEYEESYSGTYEEDYNGGYVGYNEVESEASIEEEETNDISFNQVEAFKEEPKQSVRKLKSNIVISFEQEDTMLLNTNIASVITILNSSGEQFDFKITNDGKGGQNLNIVAPAYIIGQILALFE